MVQTRKIEKIPIILVGEHFWKPLDEFMRKDLLKRGTIDSDDLTLYKITDNEDEIIKIIREAPVRNGIKFTHKDLESSGITIEPNSSKLL